MVLREFGSPVPAQTIFVSDGAMASMPNDATSLSSNSGRQLMPLFVDFQMPPAAAAMYRVLDGPGMPCTSDTRPLKFEGPTARHGNPATNVESSDCAEAGALSETTVAAPARAVSTRNRCIANPASGGECCGTRKDITATRRLGRVLIVGERWSGGALRRSGAASLPDSNNPRGPLASNSPYCSDCGASLTAVRRSAAPPLHRSTAPPLRHVHRLP